MSTLSKSIGTVAMVLAGLGLQAEDFSPLMQTVKTTWPENTHIGVICDYRSSQAQVEALANAAGGASMITVADVHRLDQTKAAAQLLAGRWAEFLVLLPEDRVAGDGSFGASMAIHRLALRGIPAVGTTPKAIAQGAVFSVGDGTHGEVLVTNRLKGTVDVILPAGVTFSQKASLPLSGSARIAVLTMK